MYYPNYLIHYNKNHSSKNGQFVSGDGDGDGITNDHSQRSKKNTQDGQKHMSLKRARQIRNAGVSMLISGAAFQTLSVAAMNTDHEAVSYVASAAALPLLTVGAVQTVRGAVSAGKAKK